MSSNKPIDETQERINKMRNGERIKCPFCKDGFWSARGKEPKEALVFGCDKCNERIFLTAKH